jgi:peptide methionine sulfoxide reductase MsrA
MRTTTLAFFCDDANGEYGLAHDNAINVENPFNAFWDARGIFHDIFEHYFEDVHPYFSGDYAFNIAGEIAAMGHVYYYINCLDLSVRARSRWGNNYIGDNTSIINGTHSDIEEGITSGYTYYGSELLCNVPYQKPVEYMEDLIQKHWETIKPLQVKAQGDERESAIYYKKSITRSKLQRLYRWGYRKAERMVNDNSHNLSTLTDFYKTFEKITEHSAAELSHDYDRIEFKIKGGASVEWNAHFIRHDNTRRNYRYFCKY